MQKILFFDDNDLSIKKNFKRTVNKLELLSKTPYIDSNKEVVSLSWGYPSVFYLEQLKKFVMYYQGWSVDYSKMNHNLPLMAMSDDGINFYSVDSRPYFPYENKILFNQTIPQRLDDLTYNESQFFELGNHFSQFKYVCLALYKDPSNHHIARTFTSIDGLHFELDLSLVWHEGDDAPDYAMSVVYNKTLKKYAIYKRPAHTDRRISVSFTTDFREYSKPLVVLSTDGQDQSLADMYSSYMMSNDGFGYIGLISIYNTPNSLKTSSLPGHKFKGGNVLLQLTYSEDGVIFKRSLRDSIIPNEAHMTCAYASTKVSLKDEERYYICGTSEEHGYTTPGAGKIQVFSIRKDGFMSLDAKKTGVIYTKPLHYQGGNIQVNLKAKEVSFSIKDAYGNTIKDFDFKDSIQFNGDGVSHIIKFSRNNLDRFKNQVITLAIKVTEGSIYSIKGNFKKLTSVETINLLNKGAK